MFLSFSLRNGLWAAYQGHEDVLAAEANDGSNRSLDGGRDHLQVQRAAHIYERDRDQTRYRDDENSVH